MKFKIHIKTINNDWWEEYDEDTTNPQEWAERTVKNFNNSLKPYEKPRKLLSVETIDEVNEKFHKWIKRTDGMSVVFRGHVVDLMYCRNCGITGKRFGMSNTVKIDSKYKKKAFLECHTAQIEIKVDK